MSENNENVVQVDFSAPRAEKDSRRNSIGDEVDTLESWKRDAERRKAIQAANRERDNVSCLRSYSIRRKK